MKKYLHYPLLFLALIFSTSIIGQDVITITEAREIDAEGSLTRLGANVELTGIAIGPNFRSGGQTWVLYDTSANLGITVFAFNNDVGYSVTDGDELKVIGELDEFNGLAEIIPESIEILSTGNPIPEPLTVTEMGEMTEANLFKIENVSLVDESQWGAANFNVDITNGITVFQMRIDGDTDIAGMPAPKGVFSVVGIGGQFDNSAPYTSGYQIFPRSVMDIDPYDTGGNTGIDYEAITLEQAREVDENGNAVRLDDNVEVSGITHGINFRPSGLQFTIINENNVGLAIFSTSNAFNYNFAAGDELIIKGKIGQFNGLTQINPDSLFVISQGNTLVIPKQIEMMEESNEGSLVMMQMTGWVDESDWSAGGSGFNIDFLNVNGVEQTIRIDADTELFNASIPDGFSFVTGIVGQFDSSEPRDEGYQLFPVRVEDFDPYLGVNQLLKPYFTIYPNPVSDIINIDTELKINSVQIFNVNGQLLKVEKSNDTINLQDLHQGIYYIQINSEEGLYVEKILKQ